jgi:hypothetical protein
MFGACLYIAIPDVPEARSKRTRQRRTALKPDEIRKLDAFFKRTFQNPQMQVKARPRKEDSAEVYVGEEFLGIVFKDEEDGDYNFSMAILDIDLA